MWITALERVAKAKRKGTSSKSFDTHNGSTPGAGKSGGQKLSAKQQKERQREIEEEERRRAEEAALQKKQADALKRAHQQKGWLTKKGAGKSAMSRRNWKRRWFIVQKAELIYFAGRGTADEKGRMALAGCEIRIQQDSKYDFHFEVWHEDRQLQLRADSKRDLEKWRTALETIIQTEVTSTSITTGGAPQLLAV